MSFDFRQFSVDDRRCAMKVGTDGVLLGAWADVAGCRHITDIGCGSGLIALMAAQRAPKAWVTGVEIDPEAARDAMAQGCIAAHHNDIPCSMARHHRSQTLHSARSVALYVVVIYTALIKVAAYLLPATMAAFVGAIDDTPGHTYWGYSWF